MKAWHAIAGAAVAWVAYRKANGLPILPGKAGASNLTEIEMPPMVINRAGLDEGVSISTVQKPPEKTPYVMSFAEKPLGSAYATSGYQIPAGGTLTAPAPTIVQKITSAVTSLIAPKATAPAPAPPPADSPFASSSYGGLVPTKPATTSTSLLSAVKTSLGLVPTSPAPLPPPPDAPNPTTSIISGSTLLSVYGSSLGVNKTTSTMPTLSTTVSKTLVAY